MTPFWRVETMGRLRVSSGLRVIDKFADQKAGVLFAYLATQPDQTHPREELIELLWPDSDPAPKRGRLNHYLWSLRKQLEPPGIERGAVLKTDRLAVVLKAEAIATDLGLFNELLRQARTALPERQIDLLRQASALCRGEFLPGVDNEWVYTMRQHIADERAALLRQLADLLGRAGQIEEAIQTLRLLTTVEPLDEQAHCALMRHYLAKGQGSLVRKQYAELEALLATHLAAEPSPEAAELLNEAGQASSSTVEVEDPYEVTDFTSHVGTAPQPTLSNVQVALDCHLPQPLTRFFGREAERTEIVRKLGEGVRLITLTGIGGAGKTRLAIEAARDVCAKLKGATWFVPLADLTDPEGIDDAILQAIGVARNTDDPPIEQIKRALRSYPKGSLIVLDNLEQFSTAGTAIVRSLLESTPKLSCLVTSRQRLALPGEHEVQVDPLPSPCLSEEAEISVEAALSFPSVALFVDRAQSARPFFQITSRNAKPIALLCSRLEGIPLALELAASWAYLLGPAQMLDQLSRRFDLLIAKSKGLPARHRSLRAVLEASYQHLAPDLQELYRSLSVFQGGFSVDAAVNISADPGDPSQQAAIMDSLIQLRERALVVEDHVPLTSDAEVRFRMLETLRDFAQEQLGDEENAKLRDRHLRYFCELAEANERDIYGDAQAECYSRIQADFENTRLALAWAVERGQAVLGLRLCTALFRFWLYRGLLVEAQNWFVKLLALPADGVDSDTPAKAHGALSMILFKLEEFSDAEFHARTAVERWRESGKPSDLAKALNALAVILLRTKDYESCERLLNESVSLAQTAGDDRVLASSYLNLALIELESGRPERSLELTEKGFLLFCRVGDHANRALALTNLGGVTMLLGDPERGCEMLLEALRIHKELGNLDGYAYTLLNLGKCHFELGLFRESRDYFDEAIRTNSQLGQRGGVVMCVKELMRHWEKNGHPENAAHALAALNVLVDFYSVSVQERDQEEARQHEIELQSQVGPERWAQVRSSVRGRSPEELISDCLDLVWKP